MSRKKIIYNSMIKVISCAKSFFKFPAGATLAVCFFYCVFSFAAYFISSLFPSLVTNIYTKGFYRIFTFPFKLIASLCPFSVTEFILFALLLCYLAGLVAAGTIAVKRKNKKEKNPLNPFAVWLSLLLCLVLTAGGNFVWLGGMNYNAISFKDLAGYNIIDVSTDELTQLCIFLRNKAAAAREELSENSNGISDDQRALYDVLEISKEGYKNLAEDYDFFHVYTAKPKVATLSTVMSYEQISGIFPIVYTESLINGCAPIYSVPHTACHELAHQLGFMREDEANFIGFLACISCNDPLYVYSGYYSAFVTAMNQLYLYDNDGWQKIYNETPAGLLKDISFENNFWRTYREKAPFIADVSESVNDKYLQFNNVDDGVRSYGRMVDLLLAHYREELH